MRVPGPGACEVSCRSPRVGWEWVFDGTTFAPTVPQVSIDRNLPDRTSQQVPLSAREGRDGGTNHTYRWNSERVMTLSYGASRPRSTFTARTPVSHRPMMMTSGEHR